MAMLRRRVGNTAFKHCLQHEQQQRRPSIAACVHSWQRCRLHVQAMYTCTSMQTHRCAALQSRNTDAPLWQHQQQQQQLVDTILYTKHAPLCTTRHYSHVHAPPISKEMYHRLVCRSSAAGSPSFPEEQLDQQAQQQQQQFSRQQPEVQQEHSTSTPPSPSAMPHLMHMQPPPQPISVPPMLSWMPPRVLMHLKSLASFLSACWALLPEFVAPSLPEALRRLVLVLGASLLLVVVVSTIDSAWLYMYLLNARRVPVAA